MAEYQTIDAQTIRRRSDGAYIPRAEGNRDYLDFLAWEGAGNTPDPADPLPIVYGRTVTIGEHRVQTVGTTPAELYRATLAPMTGYQARFRLTAVADNLLLRSIEAIVVVARGSGGAVIVQNAGAQNQTVTADHRSNATAGGWAIVPSVDGNDYAITVTGSAGRTIDWRLTGSVESFSPGGES